MSNHYPQRQITEIQLRYVTIKQTLTELFYYLNLLRRTSVYYLQNDFFLSFCTSKKEVLLWTQKSSKSSLWVLHSVLFSRYRPLPLYLQPQHSWHPLNNLWNWLKVTILTPCHWIIRCTECLRFSYRPARNQPDSSFREFCNYSVEPCYQYFQICCQYQPFKFLFLSFSRLYWQYPQ